ncbi:hypothetical protein JTB14_027035 [Gonioctena quinquepunctata]|nr:hypothetical protein JTB14_027035 [Gonioctena quinquepunctata]
MKVNVLVLFGVHLCCILGTEAFIIPDELPSLLSVIYSNIPTIKKGTDSRLGWGFRLGDRADFQVLVELGPQTNTQPLANQGEEGTSKRQTLDNLANTLYAQRQHEKKILKAKQSEKKPISNNNGADWLKTWSKSMRGNSQQESMVMKARPGLAIGEIDAKSVIPEDSDLPEQEKNTKVAKNTKVITTTSKEDALDNVDLE